MQPSVFFEHYAPKGACRDLPPDTFFPVGEKNDKSLRQIADCKSVCSSCSVLDQCREYALEYEDFGIWGGTTEEERRRWRKERKVKAA